MSKGSGSSQEIPLAKDKTKRASERKKNNHNSGYALTILKIHESILTLPTPFKGQDLLDSFTPVCFLCTLSEQLACLLHLTELNAQTFPLRKLSLKLLCRSLFLHISTALIVHALYCIGIVCLTIFFPSRLQVYKYKICLGFIYFVIPTTQHTLIDNFIYCIPLSCE